MNKRPLVFFDVPGEPRGKGRPRSFLQKGRIVHTTPPETRKYEADIRQRAKLAMRSKPVTRLPVVVDITIRVSVSQSWPAWKRELALSDRILPTAKPDDDNVVKAIKDGLNEVVYHDDCQSVSLNVQKIFDVNPGVGVEVYEVLAVPCQVKTKAELNKFLESIRG